MKLLDLCQLMPDIGLLTSIRNLRLSCDQSNPALDYAVGESAVDDGLNVLLSFYTTESVFIRSLAALFQSIPLASVTAVGCFHGNRTPLDVILLNRIDLHDEWNSFGNADFYHVRYVRVAEWNVDQDEHMISTIIGQFPRLEELVIDSAMQPLANPFMDYFFLQNFVHGSILHHSRHRQLPGPHTLEIFVYLSWLGI